MCGSHAFLVFHLHICPLLNQKLTHIVTICLDCIVDRPLVLGIDNVAIGTEAHQLLHSLDVTLSDGIIDRSLPILILAVDLYTFLDKERNNLV